MNESYTEVVEASLTGMTLKGAYRVNELIGQGGMAWVYRASHLQLGGEVALKVLFSHLSRDTAKRHRFLQEARIQYQLSHPNIVRVQDLIEENELTGFIMEWCNHGTLLHLLQQARGPLSMEQMQDIVPPMIDALGYAHQNQVIHRDLKPQNVLLHVAGASIQPRLTDFGIAKTVGDLGLTRTGEVMGTLEYASPEQLRDSKSVDLRSDIYSMGVLLYRMSTGRIPFSGAPARVIRQVLHELPPPPTEAPDGLQDLIMRCLAKRPEDRFSSCTELHEAFLSLTNVSRSSDSLRAILPSDLATYQRNVAGGEVDTSDLRPPMLRGQPTVVGYGQGEGEKSESFSSEVPVHIEDDHVGQPQKLWPRSVWFSLALGLVVVALIAALLYLGFRK